MCDNVTSHYWNTRQVEVVSAFDRIRLIVVMFKSFLGNLCVLDKSGL